MQKVTCVVKADNILGECPIWDDKLQLLCWIDIQDKRFFTYNPTSMLTNTYELPERCGSFCMCNNGLNYYLFAFENGPCFYNPYINKILYRIFNYHENTHYLRLNDGRCDRFGNFVVGGIVESNSNDKDTRTVIYKINKDLSYSTLIDGIKVTNSICFNIDGNKMYYTDSRSSPKVIYEADYNENIKVLKDKKAFVKWIMNADNNIGLPDGSCIDSDGYLWNAQFLGSKIVRYDPNGNIDMVIDIPETNPTCCCFGGKNLDTLYVTTAKYKSKIPKGYVYAIKLNGIKGLKEDRFAGICPVNKL